MLDVSMDIIKKLKLENDIERAINLTNNPNKCKYMSTYSPIFGVTNENQNEIVKIINFKDKSVLLTGSSADQYLSSVLCDSNEETIYDINVLAEYYIYLKICALRNLNYDKYLEFIFPFINKEKYFNIDIIKDISKELPTHIKDFWILYLEEIDKNKLNNLIKFNNTKLSSIKNMLPYLSEENFNILKKKINKKDYPKFIETDASYFEYSITDSYDFISLSNIIECNQQPFDDVLERRLYTDEEWINYIKIQLLKILIRMVNY